MTNSKRKLSKTCETASEDQQDRLSELPDEILLKIVQLAYNSQTNYGGSQEQKARQIITLISENQNRLCLYQHKPETPINNSFKSFSLVNRRLHSLCQPFIWQFLSFSPKISPPMSFWHQEILPKYASDVKELSVELDAQWIRIPEHPLSFERIAAEQNQHHFTFQSSDANVFKVLKLINRNRRKAITSSGPRPLFEVLHFDDLDPHDQQSLLGIKHNLVIRKSACLGPKNLLKVQAPCNKLTTLSLQFPPYWRYPDSEELINLTRNLTLVFSHLGRLRHLRYSGPHFSPIPAESIIEPLKHLPLLESLELTDLVVRDWTRADCIASSLSTLKSLKKLVLMDVDMIDYSWSQHKAPPQLSKLVISHYPNAGLSNLPSYISSWAPHLTHFELGFVGQHEAQEPEEILPTFNSEIHRFILPALTHLTIYRRFSCESFHCFTACPNLRHLTVRNPHKGGLAEFSEFIIKDVFPKLEEIVMPIKFLDSPPNSNLDPYLNLLEDFCKLKDINLKLAQGFLSRQPPLRRPKINT
ncbi:hypothetical protein DFH28DRAFT_18948 [Melampsora americana]|nr:hypothetical protein DFH28DRAFT_18948 [Melampsora americana]